MTFIDSVLTHPFMCCWTLSGQIASTEFLYTTQNGCNWVRVRRSPICACAAHLATELWESRYWSWLIMTSAGAQADGSSITRARSDLTASELMPASHARGLLWQGHEWDEIWMTLNTTGDRNSHVYLQLLEVYCNPRNWRSQRNLMKLWIVEGLYKYCLFDFF